MYSLRYFDVRKSTPSDDQPNCGAIKATWHLYQIMVDSNDKPSGPKNQFGIVYRKTDVFPEPGARSIAQISDIGSCTSNKHFI